ncbi:head-to-tail stopper [Microbacterium phage Honk]|uniref:Head-to-tail stopper n=1 Tax=Microbacterium phage Honk TaxID=2836095 RepID=A0A8F3IK96_9CAUD|nr:head-to-tail stopper [Microbacterium phage Honk]
MLTTIASTSPIYRLRPTEAVDSVGDTVTSWADPARALIPRATFDDGPSSGGFPRTEGTAELHIVGRFDITSADRVEYLGEVWRIEGRVNVQRSLASGTLTSVRLSRVEARR